MGKATESGAETEARVDTEKTTGGRRDAADGEAKQAISEAKHQVEAKAAEVKEEVKERVRGVREEAETRADHWTTSVGGRADSLGRALRAAADRLREDGESSMADMAGDAASQVERMSGYLEDERPRDMLDDFEDLGRRNPGAFVGSAFALGLVAGRFLRASRTQGEDGRVRRSDSGRPTERTGERGALGQPEHPATPARPERSTHLQTSAPQASTHAPQPNQPGRPL